MASISVGLPAAALAEEMRTTESACLATLAAAAKELIDHDFKDTPPLGVIPLTETDDLRRNEPQIMVNTAVVVRCSDTDIRMI